MTEQPKITEDIRFTLKEALKTYRDEAYAAESLEQAETYAAIDVAEAWVDSQGRKETEPEKETPKAPTMVLTDYDDVNSDEAIGGYNARKKGCLCMLVRQRYRYSGDAEATGLPEGYYGHAHGVLFGGRGYFMSLVNPECPLHGEKKGEVLDENG